MAARLGPKQKSICQYVFSQQNNGLSSPGSPFQEYKYSIEKNNIFNTNLRYTAYEYKIYSTCAKFGWIGGAATTKNNNIKTKSVWEEGAIKTS